jgi:hypothetical protein
LEQHGNQLQAIDNDLSARSYNDLVALPEVTGTLPNEASVSQRRR